MNPDIRINSKEDVKKAIHENCEDINDIVSEIRKIEKLVIEIQTRIEESEKMKRKMDMKLTLMRFNYLLQNIINDAFNEGESFGSYSEANKERRQDEKKETLEHLYNKYSVQ